MVQKLMLNLHTRRSFLGSGALAAAACASSTGSAAQRIAATSSGPAIQLGLCSYTFRNFERSQLIGFMKQLRLTELNVKDVKDHMPMDPGQRASLADYAAAGIHLHAAGAIYFQKDEDADIRSKFEYCKRAGIKVIVAGDPTVESLPRIEKFVREYDIRLAIHNHGPEDKLWHSPLDVMKAVAGLDPRIGCCIDVGHCARTGTNVVEAIHKVGSRLFNIHVKDLTDFTAKESQVAVGEGIMPVRAIFEALTVTKYQGFVDLEYEIHPEDPMPGVIASFAYMRGVLAGMNHV
jgi:sugar phosphate isomerase/epimerase